MDEFLLSLSESTVYLIGDEELISLWEDAHKRNKQLYKSDYNSKIEHLKPTKLGTCKNQKELRDAIKTKGSNRQIRTFLRTEKEVRKNNKKDGIKNNKENFNFDAQYNPKHNIIFKAKDKVPKGTMAHEMQHWRDHMYLRGKYGGRQGAFRLEKKQEKLPYLQHPTEINAYQAGYDKYHGHEIDRSEKYKERMDALAKGKRRLQLDRKGQPKRGFLGKVHRETVPDRHLMH